jgi:hypothetical protein
VGDFNLAQRDGPAGLGWNPCDHDLKTPEKVANSWDAWEKYWEIRWISGKFTRTKTCDTKDHNSLGFREIVNIFPSKTSLGTHEKV